MAKYEWYKYLQPSIPYFFTDISVWNKSGFLIILSQYFFIFNYSISLDRGFQFSWGVSDISRESSFHLRTSASGMFKDNTHARGWTCLTHEWASLVGDVCGSRRFISYVLVSKETCTWERDSSIHRNLHFPLFWTSQIISYHYPYFFYYAQLFSRNSIILINTTQPQSMTYINTFKMKNRKSLLQIKISNQEM